MGGYNAANLLGRVFGDLTVVRYAGTSKHRRLIWECRCSCGKYKTATTHLLTTGRTASCGCLKKRRTIMVKARARI